MGELFNFIKAGRGCRRQGWKGRMLQRGCPAQEGVPRNVVLSQSGAARRAALTVFVMKGELQRVLQQGPEHAVGRWDKGGIQGERSGHFLHRDALESFS